jgi:hypothetical protein
MFICFPRFYRGPFADMDPRLVSLWLSHVKETQPLISKSASWGILVQLVGSIIICLPFFVYLFFRSGRREELKGWLYVFFVTFAFAALAVFQYCRWAYYAQAAVVIPMAGLMNGILSWRQDQKNRVFKIMRNVATALTFTLGLAFVSLAAQIILGEKKKTPPSPPMIPLCEYLNKSQAGTSRRLRILTHIDFGAEILYRTPDEVIGTPYQRNQAGMLDTHDIMTAKTDEKALTLIRKRGIDTIILCPKSGEAGFYSKPGQTSTFYKRLCDGSLPQWLRKVKLPADLSAFLLFNVTKE